jgi:hypothetical protein
MHSSVAASLIALFTISCFSGCAASVDDGNAAPQQGEAVGSTASALTVLGGLDLTKQCRREYGSAAFSVLLQPVHSPGAAYAWRCRVSGVDHGIDMQLFCRWQYSNPNAFGAYNDFNDGYSWFCYLP